MAGKPQDSTEAPVLSGLTFDQLKELIAAGKSDLNAEDLATAMRKASKPENAVHPGISAYSYPEGEVARPKAKLKCRVYIGGGPMEAETLKPEEIEVLNRMTPGHYRIKRADESETIIEVRGQVNANKTLERMWIVVNAEDPDKNGFGTLIKMVSQFTDENRVEQVVA